MKSGAKLSAAAFSRKGATTAKEGTSLTCFARTVGLHALLCATYVCSVPLWLIITQKIQPQRHRAHRGCTEKKPNRDFSCEASLTFASLHLCYNVPATT